MGNIIISTTLKSENPVAHRCQHPLPSLCWRLPPVSPASAKQGDRDCNFLFRQNVCTSGSSSRRKQQQEEEAAAGGSSSSRRQQQQQEAAAAGGSSSSRRKQQQQEAAAAAGGSSRRQQQQQKEAAAAAGGSSNSSRKQQQQQQQQQQQEAAARSSKQAASKQKAATSVCSVERIMKYNKFYKSTQYKNWTFSRRTAPKQWNRPITKSCGDAKLELVPGARPPDTTSTSWYDLTLGLVGSNRIMSTKHCAQRWKSVRINNPSNKELSKSIRNTARTQVWYDFRSIDTT